MERMTECRSDGLRKCRAERAARVGGDAGVHPYGRSVPACHMSELVNHSPLLRQQQQQQQAQWFENLSHAIDLRNARSLSLNASRIWSTLQQSVLQVRSATVHTVSRET
jgi:hypothetical protein